MRSLIPWRQSAMFQDFRTEVDDLCRRMFGRELTETNGDAFETWKPSCDVEEGDKEIQVKVELPGVDAKDIEISINDDALVVKGEKKVEREDKKKNYHRTERFVGQFYRQIPLPPGTDEEKVTAASKSGVVTITIPKKPGVQPKKIAVKAEA